HPVRMMVAAGQKTRARRRTKRRRVHVVVEQAILRKAVQIRGIDWRAVAAELAKTGVVQDDKKNIRGAGPGPQWLRPRRGRFGDRAAKHAGKCASRFVFNQLLAIRSILL